MIRRDIYLDCRVFAGRPLKRMSLVLSGRKLRSCAVWIASLALAQAAWAATPVPVPQPPPAATSAAADPLGALLQEQGLIGGGANLPVVIGLKLNEAGKNSRFTLEFSDPVDVRIFTLAGPQRPGRQLPDVFLRVARAA